MLPSSGVFKGKRARHLPRAPPFLGPPLEVLRAYIFLTFGEKFSIHSSQTRSQVSSLFSSAPPTETVMSRYFTFRRAPNSNLKVICFQRGSQLPLKCVSTSLLNFIEGAPNINQCVSTLFSKGPPKATVMCKYLAFNGALTTTVIYNYLLSKRLPTAIVMCKYQIGRAHV